MSEIPKLTADEATVLAYHGLCHDGLVVDATRRLREKGLLSPEGITDPRRAALAAFDAAERAKIRVEAMRECEEVAAEFAKRSERVDDPREFFEDLILDIRALIAKETP